MEYRITRVIFGATPSPYIWGSTLQKHVKQFEEEYPKTTKTLLEDTCVDDAQAGDDSIEELQNFKEEATTVMDKGGFRLHKWHSNADELGDTTIPATNQKCPTPIRHGNGNKTTKILGIPWQKEKDTIQVSFERCPAMPLTKLKIRAIINGVFDVLGFASPITIIGKIIFSEIGLQKLG